MRAAFVIVLALLAGCVSTGDAGENPDGRGRWATDPKLLTRPTVVSASWVASRLGDCVIFDVRSSAEAFAAGHLEGAVHLPTSKLRRSFGYGGSLLLPREDLIAQFADVGVGDGMGVIVYAGDRLSDASHAVVALLTIGHPLVAIMEGGFDGWKAAGYAVTDVVATPSPRSLTLAPSLVTVVSDDQMTSSPMAILDARPSSQFADGHIPNARNRPARNDVVTVQGVWWKSRRELQRAYADLDVGTSTPVAVSCRTGLSATQTWFTLSVLLGYDDVRWHDGSWLSYTAGSSRPIEKGVTSKPAPTEPPAIPPTVPPIVEPHPSPPTVPPVIEPPPSPPQPSFARHAIDPENLTRPCIVSTGYVAGGARGAILLDTRSRADYVKGHLPGARHFRPQERLMTSRGERSQLLLSPSALAVAFGQVGIDLTTPVVCYGDTLEDPCLTALALLATGHQRVGVMEGGVRAWLADKRSLTTTVPRVTPSAYAVQKLVRPVTADLADVLAAIEGKSATLVDVRDPLNFAGSSSARSGHIAGAVNFPCASIIIAADGVWWPSRESILRACALRNIEPTTRVMTLGQDGRESAFAWWTLAVIAGFDSVRWYDGGYEEWTSDPRRPLEVSPTK